MPKYFTKTKRWLSHECRTVESDTEFETTFPPGPGGKPMRLSDDLIEVKPKKEKEKDEPIV